jgi:hypothetical protein
LPNVYIDFALFFAMEYNAEKKEIILNRNINLLDKFVIDSVKILENHTKYVIVSGYVSIVLGRSRATEDIDLLIPQMEISNFIILFNNLITNGYECANSSNPLEAFEMLNVHAIRFFSKGKPIPNIEFKFIKNDSDRYSFDNKIKLILKDNSLFISPLEMQIAYKLFLSSEKADKDMEDARHLYKLFKDNINKEKLALFMKKFKVEGRFKELE